MIDRYTRPEMAKLWTDEYRFEKLLEVEVLASEALVRQKKVPAEAVSTIRKKAKIEQERQAKLAKEQAERDREQAKKQAEIDKKQQKVVDEAAAKLKAAQDAYQAELAKKNPKDR